MADKIRTTVARILNSREIVIAAGSDDGIIEGMFFDVMDVKGEDIADPDTGVILGSLQRPKVRVQVTQVQPKMSVASTYKKQRVNIGGTGISAEFGALSRALLPPKYVTKYETLKTDEKTWEDLEEEQSYVKTGDPVVEVVEVVALEDEAVEDPDISSAQPEK